MWEPNPRDAAAHNAIPMQNVPVIALSRHGSEVVSAFDLLGRNENDLTAALGFVLSRCPQLAIELLGRVSRALKIRVEGEPSLALEVRVEVGRTDLEIRVGDALFIVEAKRGWLLPSQTQLKQYANRVEHHRRGALITLSQASHALARKSLPATVDGIPVVHLPWAEVLADIEAIKPDCKGRERFWLDELRAYLKEVVKVRNVAESWTYSVVLNDERPGGGATFKEIVTDQLAYFHPYGEGGWPTEPPNFMAFRWDGAVRRIHRVMNADVVPHLQDRYPYMTTKKNPLAARPHAVYGLGPQLPPLEPIPNGAPYRATRLWVLLDQLQTAPSLAEAISRTKALNGGPYTPAG